MEELKRYKDKIDALLFSFLTEEKERAKPTGKYNVQVHSLLSDFCLRGGKRIRPILLIEAYKLVGGKDIDQIMKASLSMELLEDFLLIHDDIIDRDEIRRGGPSFHKMAEELTGNSHFGLSTAIIGGDMLSALAIQPILKTNLKNKERAISEFIHAELSCFYGELLDIMLEKEDDTKEEDFFKMIDLKTASYTTIAPLVIGAILGEANDEQIETLRTYGKLLGQAFQITDDILGVFGDEKRLGKPVDSDIKEGKKTLLIIYALNNVKDEDKNFLKSCLGNSALAPEDLIKVREVLKSSGALTYSRNKAKEIIESAKAILKNNFTNASFLIEIADFIIERSV